MADWENIPRLDPALQDEIDNVQLKHNALVEAVRGYSGGSIAGKTNEVMGTHQDNLDTVATREKSLISAVGQPEPSPSMLLDFASQTYFTGVRGLEQAVDPHKYLTVSRATPKWVMGPQGKLVEVPPDTLAYEYDPATGEAKGVLIEESKTNKVLDSSNFYLKGPVSETATFVERGLSFSTFTPEAGSGGLNNYGVGVSLAPRGQVFEAGDVISVYFKPAGVTRVNFRRDDMRESPLVAGSFDLEAETATKGAVENLGGGLYRLVSIPLESGGSLSAGYVITFDSSQADGVNSFSVAGHQIEAGPVATSYIPTAGSPVTRAADNVSRVLGEEFSRQEGTLLAEVYDPHTEGRASYFHTASTARGESFGLGRVSSNLRLSVHSLGQGNGTDVRIASPVGAFAMALSYSVPAKYLAASVLGASATITPEAILIPNTLKTVPRLGGRYGPGFHIKALAYYPYAMTEQELQELTANG